jgi:hypothetical protein
MLHGEFLMVATRLANGVVISGRRRTMPLSAKLLEMINNEIQNVPINDQRWPELAIELQQLLEAAEAAEREHDFDRDPAEFLALLRSQRT